MMNLPNRRNGIRGSADVGSHVIGRKLHARKPFASLKPNPRYGRRRLWPLRDSRGRLIVYIEQHSTRWDMHETPDGPPIYMDRSMDDDQLELQGRGAMTRRDWESRYALVGFAANYGDFMRYRLKGFIQRAALPDRLAAIVDDYDAGHGSCRLSPESISPLPDPGFDSGRDKFEGTDGIRRTYATYNAHVHNAIYVCVNTTGVRGGGVVRGVLRAGQSVRWLDRMGEPDPNSIPGSAQVRWHYVCREGIGGWVAQRA